MAQSKVVSAKKGKIVENKPSTEVHKSISVVEERSSDAAREKLFHVKMQIKNTVLTTFFYHGSQKNLIFESWVQQLVLKTTVHPASCTTSF
jgi:hypothetical protein